jgi:hypothetical protein
LSVIAGLVLLVFHLLLTPNVSGDKDAGEFAIVLAFFGAAHPTGYPLYTLLGGLFVHLLHVFGAPWVWAANAFSAVGAAVAGGLLHALSARLLAREGSTAPEAEWGALLPVAAFAVHPLWTAAASQAEVHTWHIVWVLSLLLAAAAILEPNRSRSASGAASPVPGPFVWGLLVGVGLAHHLTSVLVSGPLTLAVLGVFVHRRGVWLPTLARLVAGAVLPLIAYGFIAWRAFHPAPGQWGTLSPHWRSVLAHVTGREYRVYVGHFAPSGAELELIRREVVPWLAVGLPLVVWWALTAHRTSPALRLGVVAAIATTLLFVGLYGVPDPSAYLLTPLALAFAVTPVAFRCLPGAGAITRPVAIAALVAIGVEAFHGIGLAWDRNHAYRAYETHVRTLWRTIPDRPAFVLWSDDMVSLLHGYQLLEGEKPQLEIHHPMQLTQDWPRAQFIRSHGFDPVSRADVAAAAARTPPRNVEELARLIGDVIAQRLNTHSRLEVDVFEPDSGVVRRLPKGVATAGVGRGDPAVAR